MTRNKNTFNHLNGPFESAGDPQLLPCCFQTARALAIANSLLGNINREGGIYFPKSAQLGELQPKHPAPELPKMGKSDGTGMPGRYPLGSYGDGITHAIPELALRGELKAGFVYHNNPLRTNPNPKRVNAD